MNNKAKEGEEEEIPETEIASVLNQAMNLAARTLQKAKERRDAKAGEQMHSDNEEDEQGSEQDAEI